MTKYVTIILLLCSIANAQECPSSSSGLVTLALLNPRFPVAKAAEALSTSPHPSFAFLHKTFGSKYENVKALIDRLNPDPSAGRCVTVIIYGDCGPCRTPRRPRGLFQVMAPSHSIGSLNRALEKGNLKVLKEHNREYEAIESKLPQLPGVRYIFMPALEDNFTTRSFQVVEALAEQVFAHRPDVAIGRNPLRYKRATGVREIHSYSTRQLGALKRGDILTGDGDTMCFPGESRCRGRGLRGIRKLVLEARRKGVHLLLWRPENQGLPLFIDNRPAFIPVSRRKYQIRGVKHIKQLLKGD